VKPEYMALVPMLPVTDVTRSVAFYEQLGFRVGNTHVNYPFYNPRGEFHVHDPDGYAIFIAHAD
jgi:hypothetical protein